MSILTHLAERSIRVVEMAVDYRYVKHPRLFRRFFHFARCLL
jgi:hypothetical protein